METEVSEKHWVDSNHYRTVSEDGSRSYLYEANGGLFGVDSCVEISEHHSDGTTQAYEPDMSLGGLFLNDGLGKKK